MGVGERSLGIGLSRQWEQYSRLLQQLWGTSQYLNKWEITLSYWITCSIRGIHTFPEYPVKKLPPVETSWNEQYKKEKSIISFLYKDPNGNIWSRSIKCLQVSRSHLFCWLKINEFKVYLVPQILKTPRNDWNNDRNKGKNSSHCIIGSCLVWKSEMEWEHCCLPCS